MLLFVHLSLERFFYFLLPVMSGVFFGNECNREQEYQGDVSSV